jgi:hypothetical protein
LAILEGNRSYGSGADTGLGIFLRNIPEPALVHSQICDLHFFWSILGFSIPTASEQAYRNSDQE